MAIHKWAKRYWHLWLPITFGDLPISGTITIRLFPLHSSIDLVDFRMAIDPFGLLVSLFFAHYSSLSGEAYHNWQLELTITFTNFLSLFIVFANTCTLYSSCPSSSSSSCMCLLSDCIWSCAWSNVHLVSFIFKGLFQSRKWGNGFIKQSVHLLFAFVFDCNFCHRLPLSLTLTKTGKWWLSWWSMPSWSLEQQQQPLLPKWNDCDWVDHSCWPNTFDFIY